MQLLLLFPTTRDAEKSFQSLLELYEIYIYVYDTSGQRGEGEDSIKSDFHGLARMIEILAAKQN